MSKVKAFFIIVLLYLIPLFHVYELAESTQHLIHYLKNERTITVKPAKKEAIMKTPNVNPENHDDNKKPETKYAGSHFI